MSSKTLTLILFLIALAGSSACSHADSQHPAIGGQADAFASLSPSPTPQASSLAVQNSPIRSIDFENFTYPASPIFGRRRKTFTLRDGVLPAKLDKHGWLEEVGLAGGATYFDVTGDGVEDAIVGFSQDNRGGTAIVYAAYIYTLQHGRPMFLWGFEAGDRADGGLRSIYGEDGELVVELEGKDKVIGKNLFAEDKTSAGACCPTLFTRTRYKWDGKRFRPKAPPEILPLDGEPDDGPFPEKPPQR